MLRALTALSFLASLIVAAPAAPVPKGEKLTPYFPTRLGTKWVLKTDHDQSTWVVTEVKEKDGAITVSVCSDTDGKLSAAYTMVVTESGLTQTALGGEALDPPICILKTPPKASDKWEARTTVLSLFEMHTTFKVLDAEGVEVPAGKFKAFPVMREFTIALKEGPRKAPQPQRVIEWYAPGVGLIKRQLNDQKDVTVMASFTPGK